VKAPRGGLPRQYGRFSKNFLRSLLGAPHEFAPKTCQTHRVDWLANWARDFVTCIDWLTHQRGPHSSWSLQAL
jgi:hypothetical protein